MGIGCNTDIEGYKNERLMMGGGRMEEGKGKSRKTVETGGEGGIDLNFVTIATEPRFGGVSVQGWNITTS